MRLNRYLAASGFGSRRACEALILAGKVSINGHFLRELSTRVAEGDDVRVAGKRAVPPRTTTVVALHKPKGFVCTRSDELGRRTIYDLLPRTMSRFIYIGRLDRDSEGLLLLTDDGALADALARPARKVEKEYEVNLDQPLDKTAIPKLIRGLHLPSGKARMERVIPIGECSARVVLCQGMKRQIREMFFRVNREVTRLVRVRIGPVLLGDLPAGHWRHLRRAEVAALQPDTKRNTS